MTKDIEEKRRELFEAKFPMPAWVTWNVDRSGYYSPFRDSTRKRSAENYDSKWRGFNAALDAVVIDLPEPEPFGISAEESLEMDYEEFEELEARHGAQYSTYCKCRAAIESTGLGLKIK